eukprot:gb/GECG01002801.1/.p1 GENE.gb/GECG01002801.1/~~gb/GECG01002801.1/.p1  ORF type:complete len:495 (+),score=57.87 gb/GECG01002801.1/:1-1485(+)
MSRVYQEGAKAFRQVVTGQRGLKDIIYSSQAKNKKKLYALVCESLKYRPILEDLIFACGMDKHLNREESGSHTGRSKAHKRKRDSGKPKDEVTVDAAMLCLMLYEHLFGNGIKGGGTLKRLILQYDGALQKSLNAMKQEKGVSENVELLPAPLQSLIKLPRYVRVNLLKCTMQDAITELRNTIQGMAEEDIKIDELVPDLLVLPGSTNEQVAMHPWVANGSLILQDKSSCLPATAARETIEALTPSSFDITDACAAPGNKTSHLASLLTQTTSFKGHIWACEKDYKRSQLLTERLRTAEASMVDVVHADFLALQHDDSRFTRTKLMIVDPSCSGSGMVHRLDFVLDSLRDDDCTTSMIFKRRDKGKKTRKGGHLRSSQSLVDENEETHVTVSNERINHLARIQEKILSHAMRFPSVQQVLYSTCSLHQEENEDVVASVLRSFPDWGISTVLPKWHRRGSRASALPEDDTTKMVRVDPYTDSASGFFLALLQRKH